LLSYGSGNAQVGRRGRGTGSLAKSTARKRNAFESHYWIYWVILVIFGPVGFALSALCCNEEWRAVKACGDQIWAMFCFRIHDPNSGIRASKASRST